MLNIKPFKEFISENIQYSGGDVTKMKVIGKVTTIPIGPFEEASYDVVEIIHDPKGNPVYVCNFWYKDYKRIPQLIHSELVKEYVSLQDIG